MHPIEHIWTRDSRPALAPGENGCPGPENYQDCPAPPRKCLEFNCYPAALRGFYCLPQPEIFFLCPAPKQKRLPRASLVLITELLDKEEQLVFFFLQTIYGGTNEIMKELIARSIVKEAA